MGIQVSRGSETDREKSSWQLETGVHEAPHGFTGGWSGQGERMASAPVGSIQDR